MIIQAPCSQIGFDPYIGKIDSIDTQKEVIAITDSSETYSLKMKSYTLIWLDKSKSRKTNEVENTADCNPGRRVEVKYKEAEKNSSVTGEWIKVEVAASPNHLTFRRMPACVFGAHEKVLTHHLNYYYTCRNHLSLNKDPPDTRTIEPPELGNIVAFPRVGGFHHRYTRRAA